MMKFSFTISICAWISIVSVFGQVPTYEPSATIKDVPFIVCPASDEQHNHFVPAEKNKSPYKTLEVQIIPTYSAEMPQEAIDAIENGVIPIINETFSSTVPINIQFNWEQTDPNALAAARPTFYQTNFVNDLRIFNVWYPGPLAEKIARMELNDPGEADIEVTISSTRNWCYDCNTPEEVGARFDFISTLLHEIYHGLGFTAFSNVNDSEQGFQRLQGLTTIYNNYLEIRSGERTALQNDGSAELFRHFTGGDLLFNIPTSSRAQLYSPNPYEPGSSVSHLDDRVFDGGSNSLMTSSSAMGEVERAGGIATTMMYDMGWAYTHMTHTPADVSIENSVNEDYTVALEITSDVGYMEDSLRLHYSADEFVADDNVVMFTSLGEGKYSAVIPAPGVSQVVTYYMEVVDNRELRYSSPGVNVDGRQFTHQYAFGPDDIDPTLTHIAIESVKTVDRSLDLFANATDIYAGLDTLYVQWKINGEDQNSVGMELDTADLFENDRYIATLNFPSTLLESDLLEYRIIAQDASSVKNISSSPAAGFHVVAVIPLTGPRSEYINQFDNGSEADFTLSGFQVEQPSGFADAALHSDHPYAAAGENRTLNLTAELNFPIILKGAGDATMIFNEIALIEPSEPGTSFGETEFWDYVIVEGKKVGSNAWLPFIDGYDSRAQSAWFSAYNRGIPAGGQDSDRNGDITQFRERNIDLLANGNFAELDTVLIRFRLFSDPFARGWGWVIDNLQIQDVISAVEDYIVKEDFKVYPNPAGESITVSLDLISVSDQINITIQDILGRTVQQRKLTRPSRSILETFSLEGLDNGIYIIEVGFNDRDKISQKILKQ